MLTLNVETSKAINTAIADNYGICLMAKISLYQLIELHQAVRANWDKRQSVVDRNNNNDDNYNNNGNKTNENKDDDVGVAPPVIPPIIVDTWKMLRRGILSIHQYLTCTANTSINSNGRKRYKQRGRCSTTHTAVR